MPALGILGNARLGEDTSFAPGQPGADKPAVSWLLIQKTGIQEKLVELRVSRMVTGRHQVTSMLSLSGATRYLQ